MAVQPLFCVGQYRLGLAYEKKGDLPLAREAFTKAVDTDLPQCKRLQDAYSARARVLARQGLKEEARADLTRCRDMGVQTPRVRSAPPSFRRTSNLARRGAPERARSPTRSSAGRAAPDEPAATIRKGNPSIQRARRLAMNR